MGQFKRLLAVFFMIIVLASMSTSCGLRQSKDRIDKNEKIYTHPDVPNGSKDNAAVPNPSFTGSSESDQKPDFTQPAYSGETTIVPWENNNEFKTAQGKNNTFVLMAAYRTVLPDPLPGEEFNVHHAARLLAGKVVKPGQVFSQNQQIGPYTEPRGFKIGPTYIGSELKTTIGGGVCKIASTLYNVAVQSHLQIVERHAHSMPVPYVPYGQDATVSYGTYDFKFKNDTSFPILLWAQGVDNVLYIGFYGREKPPKVTWNHETQKTSKAPIIYKTKSNLTPGTEKVVNKGMDGATVKSWVSIERPDGTKTLKQLGISYYDPMPQIIERSK